MDLLHIYRPQLRQSSLVTYQHALRRAYTLSGRSGPVPARGISWIDEGLLIKVSELNPTLARNLCTPLMILLRDGALYDRFKKLVDEKRSEQLQQPGQKSVRDEEQWVKYPEIVRARDALRKLVQLRKPHLNTRQHRQALRYIYLCWITMHPPLRLDYATLRFGTGVHSNHVDLDRATLTLVHHKTVGKTGVHTDTLSGELVAVLRKWLRHCKPVNGRQFVFCMPSGRPYSRRSLGVWIKNLFDDLLGKQTSQGTVRKIVASHHHKPIADMNERRELAKRMGHSVATQNQYYLK